MFTNWRTSPKGCQTYPDEEPRPGDTSDNEPNVTSPIPGTSDDPWEAFVSDDDQEPLPEPGDFWFEE